MVNLKSLTVNYYFKVDWEENIFNHLETLHLYGFEVTWTTNFLHKLPKLKSISMGVRIQRGKLELPLFEEIVSSSPAPYYKFWKNEYIQRQTSLKRLVWDDMYEEKIDILELPLQESYSDKYFNPEHFDSSAKEYHYTYVFQPYDISQIVVIAETLHIFSNCR